MGNVAINSLINISPPQTPMSSRVTIHASTASLTPSSLTFPLTQTLPPLCPWRQTQRSIYDRVLEKSVGAATTSAKDIKNIFTELRKAANHPLLLLNHFDSSGKIDEVVSVLHRSSYYGAEASRDMVRRVQVRDESETCGRDVVRQRTGADVKSIWRVRACVRLVL